jgi:hypothetical protein
MRLPRLRLRTLLIAVALIAAALFVGLMWRRATEYRARAADAASAAEVWAVSAKTSEAASDQCRREARHEADPQERLIIGERAREYAEHAAMCRAQEAHRLAMRRKYERTARYPWLSVEPGMPPVVRE